MNKFENLKQLEPKECSFGKLYSSLKPEELDALFKNGELIINEFNTRFAYNSYGLNFNAGDFFVARLENGEEKTIKVISKEQKTEGDTIFSGIYKVKFIIEKN